MGRKTCATYACRNCRAKRACLTLKPDGQLITNDRNVVVCRYEEQHSQVVCPGNLIAFPQRPAPLYQVAFFHTMPVYSGDVDNKKRNFQLLRSVWMENNICGMVLSTAILLYPKIRVPFTQRILNHM